MFLVLLWLEFFAWLRNPKESIPAWFFYIAQLIMIAMISIIYACLRHKYDVGCFSSAVKVRYVGRMVVDGGYTLIAGNTSILEINRIVSVCFRSKDDDIEETVAIGYVETKNDLGNFQIKAPKEWCLDKYDLQSLGHKLLIIKPAVSKDDLAKFF